MSTAEAEIVQPFTQRRAIRSYSQQERAQALAIYDQVGTLEKASEVAGIPMSTLAGWVNDPSNHSLLRSQKAQELATKFENAAHLFIDLAVKKAKKAGFNHLMTGAGIAVDKSQLLKGAPTSISEQVDRQELTIILSSALSAGAIDAEGQVVEGDVTDNNLESV